MDWLSIRLYCPIVLQVVPNRFLRKLISVSFSTASALTILGLVETAESLTTQNDQRSHRIEAVLVEEGPIIDGSLDDPVWEQAFLIDSFVQQEPDEGEPSTERTEVRVLHDPKNLYLGVFAFDSEPDQITATEMRRDSEQVLQEDNIQIVLDTFMDSRSAYMFVTNPLGAKVDQQISNEGEGGYFGRPSSNVNRDWDGVWHVVAKRVSNGWVAEVAIPMVTLRFPKHEPQSWGINIMRNIGRKNEQVFWAPVPKAYGIMRVSLAGALEGLRSLNRGRDLRITPFINGGASRKSVANSTESSFQRDMGLDVKYGVTASLNLDVTINTDFAEAEVDDEQVNLTRFPLFYPEKRDFFLENAGQFNVGSVTSFNRLADLFFTRRIGLSESGGTVPIRGGARLTGKVGANDIAIMDVQTEDAFGRSGENFLVARYSRHLFARSKVGGLFINKMQTNGEHFNRTYAVDMSLAPHANMTITGFVAKTETPGVVSGDLGAYLNATWLSDKWRIYGEYADFQDGFNPEVGFLPRRGIRTTKLHMERNPRPGFWGIRVLSPMYNITYTTDQNNQLVSRRHHFMNGTRFDSGAYLNVMYNLHYERLDMPFTVHEGVTIPVGEYSFAALHLAYNSNPSRQVYYNLSLVPQTFFGGNRTDMQATVGARLTSQASIEGSYARNNVNLPAGNFDLNLAFFRLDYAFSPTITLRSVTQYNSSKNQWGTSARLRYTYKPGSEVFLVYDELQRDPMDPTGLMEFRDRRLIFKVTYLFSR